MFKFIYDGDSYKSELTFGEGEALTHEQVAEWFNQFLRGVGYNYDGEYVRVSEEEENALWRYNREKNKTAFMDKVYGTDSRDEEDAHTFPVI